MPVCLKQEELVRLRREGPQRGLLSSRKRYVPVPPGADAGDEIGLLINDQLLPIRVPPGAQPGAYLEVSISHMPAEEDDWRRVPAEEQDTVATQVTDLVRKGTAAFAAGRLQEAIEVFSAGTELNPRHTVLYNNRSACYLQLGMSAEALRDADECIALDPSYYKGFLRKGEALHDMREFETAAACLSMGMWLEPTSQELLLAMQRLQAGASAYRDASAAGLPRMSSELAEWDPDSDSDQQPNDIRTAELCRERGNIAHLASRFHGAIHHFTVGLVLSPNNTVLLNNRSKAFFDIGHFQRSLSDAELCIATRPGWFRGWLRAALAMIKLSIFGYD